jgi:hypothetical protein
VGQVSVTSLSEASGSSDVEATIAPTLRLVPDHEHTWELRMVEFDDGLEVRRYECRSCDDVVFR